MRMGDGLFDPLVVTVRHPTGRHPMVLQLAIADRWLKAAQPEGEVNWPIPRQGRR